MMADLLCNGAKKELGDAAPPVSSKHQQIDAMILSEISKDIWDFAIHIPAPKSDAIELMNRPKASQLVIGIALCKRAKVDHHIRDQREFGTPDCMQKMNDSSELAGYEQGVPRCAIRPGREISGNRDVAHDDIRRWMNYQTRHSFPARYRPQNRLCRQSSPGLWYSVQLQIGNVQGIRSSTAESGSSPRYRVPAAGGVVEESACAAIRYD